MRDAVQIHKRQRKRRLSAPQIVLECFCEYHRGAISAELTLYAFQIQDRAQRVR